MRMDILCFPRELITGLEQFTPWNELGSFLDNVNQHLIWMPRGVAESSDDLVQPIPCGFFHDGEGNFLVLRRSRGSREDLSRRLSLVVGGHVDPPDPDGLPNDVENLLLYTFQREVLEEVFLSAVESLRKIGLVIDRNSLSSSRHLGFVYEVSSGRDIQVLEDQEYATKAHPSGRFLPMSHLLELRHHFDPWSKILLEQFIEPNEAHLRSAI
jgi:predicted NUDIX family phosphoesterase